MYPEVIEPRELPQLLHLRPAADLGGGHVETRQTGRDVVQVLQGGQVGNRTFCETEELNPEI